MSVETDMLSRIEAKLDAIAKAVEVLAARVEKIEEANVCFACSGRGHKWDGKCQVCDGTGRPTP